MISPVPSMTPAVWRADAWHDAEVVDSVLVEEPAPRHAAAAVGELYDRFGRRAPADGRRYGALVSVLA
ncbi:MAG: hypothetical protein QOD81_194 [Solirubrobacteraceae bacterium]|nr:hypothetical protein [Solirubrobacteraceae bacterium]